MGCMERLKSINAFNGRGGVSRFLPRFDFAGGDGFTGADIALI